MRKILTIFIFLLLSKAASACVIDNKINVFVAASLNDVVKTIANDFIADSLCKKVVISFASSSNIARQILKGAPADIFISADFYNANLVASKFDKQLIKIFGNKLIIAGANDFNKEIELKDLSKILGKKRLAIADPNHVPAGIYAKEALKNAKIWDELQGRLAPAANVRSANIFVIKKASPFSITYASEVKLDGLKKIGEIDESLYSPINYWAVILNEGNSNASEFLEFLKTEKSQEIIKDYGFILNDE